MPVTRIAHGIVLMLVAVTLFACMNALVKLLTPHFDPLQLVWARTFGHLLFILALFVPRFGLKILRSQRLGTQCARSIIQTSSTVLFFIALSTVPLAEATSISFLAPLLVTVLAALMLGEKIVLERLAVVLIGFVGVLVIVRPGSDVFQWSSLLILASSTCYAIYQVLTRRVAGLDRAETSAIYSALIGSVVMCVVVPFFWTTPESLKHVVLLLCLGIFGGLGHYCVAGALSNAPANLVSPFSYFQLVVATAFGYLLFDAVPSLFTLIGASMIVGSGLYLGWRETVRRA